MTAESTTVPSDRFRPSRAGIINIWDYADEEFAFGDGRLVLRGHNGSGKTKALEVLFPFVLDGVADARRLDPFSGENRTMKSNLLYQGQDAAYGYVWMEFARPTGETVTLVIGMRAHRNRDGVRTSFFVTDRRVGVDFGLLTSDSRPLTEKQLKAVLGPDAHRDSASAYRDAVDARLFGLGRERYTQLLNLLLALRRPLLAKDLDPVKVSETLTSGLSPVEEDLVGQAARDFENLAAVQKRFDDATAADTAVRAFLGDYTNYLRVRTAAKLSRIQAAHGTVVGHLSGLADAMTELRRATTAHDEAVLLRDDRDRERAGLRRRLEVLRTDEAYRAQGEVELQRQQIERTGAEITSERQRVERGTAHLAALRSEADQWADRLDKTRAETSRHATEMAEAAERSGIANDGDGLADTGADLLTTAQARGTARRADVEHVRAHIRKVEDTEKDRRRAEDERDGAEQAVTDRERACQEADAELGRARQSAREDLERWARHWVGGADESGTGVAGRGEPEQRRVGVETDSSAARQDAGEGRGPEPDPGRDRDERANSGSEDVMAAGPADAVGSRARDAATAGSDDAVATRPGDAAVAGPADAAVAQPSDAAALAEAIEQVGSPGAATLAEVFTERTEDRRIRIAQRAQDLGKRVGELDDTLARLRRERDEIAAERDDAPPSDDRRPADRTNRPGAPLWRLVRFADDVDPAAAAGIEGALYGAGLLTAWLHPDPELTRAAVAVAEPDGYLRALPADQRPTGRTLADVLLPEDQDAVPEEAISAVLRSIALDEDPAVSGDTAEGARGTTAARTTGATEAADGSRAPNQTWAGESSVAGDPAAPEPTAVWNASLVPTVSTAARFSLGVHLGALPKPAPEYVGATNRENRRKARLTAYAESIDAAERERDTVAARRADAERLVAAFGEARADLPPTGPILTANERVAHHSTLLGTARTDLATKRTAHDAAVAAVDTEHRKLRQAAAERGMPTAAADVDAVERAVADFHTAAQRLHDGREQARTAEEDLAARRDTIEHQTQQLHEDTEALEEKERRHDADRVELATREEAMAAPLREVLAQVTQTEERLRDLDAQHRRHADTAAKENEARIRAETRLDEGQGTLAEAFGHLFEHVGEFAPYANRDLRPLVGVTVPDPWPEGLTWPEPADAAAAVTRAMEAAAAAAENAPPEGTAPAKGPTRDEGEAANAATPEDTTAAAAAVAPADAGEPATPSAESPAPAPDPHTLVRHALPTGVADLLDAYTAALSEVGGVSDTAVKNVDNRLTAALHEFQTTLDSCGEDYRVDHDPTGIVLVHVSDDTGRNPVAAFARRVADLVDEQGALLKDRERTVLEDGLLTELAQQIHERVRTAQDLVKGMDRDTRSRPMSSGTKVGIRWVRADHLDDRQAAVARLLKRDAETLGPAGLAELRGLLREMVRDYRAGHPRATYRQAVAHVVDYRAWYNFELVLAVPGEDEVKLTRAKHGQMSGGEKSAAIHLPLFAAANALYSSATPTCPRMIALDEAFAGIDDRYKPDLLGLTVKFDLDLFMTGHDLWVHYDSVPMAAHYDMHHNKSAHAVSAMLMLWDGTQTIDADAGFAGNEELAASLLGITPTRHAPATTEGTLLASLGEGEEGPDDG